MTTEDGGGRYLTENRIGNDLLKDKITVEEAVRLFEGNDVYVKAARNLDPNTKTWDDVELSQGSTILFHALTIKGATEEQKDRVGAEIVRLRAIGNIFV